MNPLDVARFWSKVDVGSSMACWEWRASRQANGYGQFACDGRMLRAHRLAYELVRGPVPGGLVLDHLCRNRACCNPAHLEPVTLVENVMRGESFSAANAQKTHCPQGHPYSPENTILKKGRYRVCRLCKLAAGRRHYAALKAASDPPG